MRKEAISAILSLGLLVPLTARAAVPEWLRSLAQQPTKKYDDRVNAVILLDETETTVKDTGETVTRVRQAVRVLRPEGRSAAYQRVPFDDETKLNYMKGWSISATGQEYQAKSDEVVQLSGGEGYEIYSDEKYQAMRIPGVDVGTIVGVEWEQKRHPFTFEDHWFFQNWLPVERARFVLHLPSGWDFRAAWINHTPQTPASQGRTYVWELLDVPSIEVEEAMPPWRALAGQLIVTFFSDKTKGRSYADWKDFAAWYSQLTAEARNPSPALHQKVEQLAPASLPLPERIRVLARFVQHDIRYAAIEIGIGGYQPHPAAQVLRDGYGDCKDKATLLSAMLSQIGVNSYYVPVHTDRGIYTDKTPPTNGFNHVVLAIQLPEAANSDLIPAIYEHPALGRLLIFDPTSTVVPLGQLPSYEQDNYGLLVTGQGGELIHLPLSRPESNRIDRNAKFTLLPDGTLKAEVEEARSGSMAAEGRLRLAHENDGDRRKALEQFVGRTPGNFQFESAAADNLDDIDKDLIIHYTFVAERYAKNAGPLLLLRPSVLGENLGPLNMTKPRHYPYEFQVPTLQTDTFEFILPDGYKVDALPDPVQAAFAFGDYSSKVVNDGASLKYIREYKIKTTTVPPERITDLGKLFSEMNEDERNMAVLKKAN